MSRLLWVVVAAGLGLGGCRVSGAQIACVDGDDETCPVGMVCRGGACALDDGATADAGGAERDAGGLAGDGDGPSDAGADGGHEPADAGFGGDAGSTGDGDGDGDGDGGSATDGGAIGVDGGLEACVAIGAANECADGHICTAAGCAPVCDAVLCAAFTQMLCDKDPESENFNECALEPESAGTCSAGQGFDVDWAPATGPIVYDLVLLNDEPEECSGSLGGRARVLMVPQSPLNDSFTDCDLHFRDQFAEEIYPEVVTPATLMGNSAFVDFVLCPPMNDGVLALQAYAEDGSASNAFCFDTEALGFGGF